MKHILKIRKRKRRIKEESKIETGKICSYHSCTKTAGLKKCAHCGKLFCREHLKPKLPMLPSFERRGIVGSLYMEEWRESGGHPCPPYYDYVKTKQKEQLEKEWEALNKMRKLPPKTFEDGNYETMKLWEKVVEAAAIVGWLLLLLFIAWMVVAS